MSSNWFRSFTLFADFCEANQHGLFPFYYYVIIGFMTISYYYVISNEPTVQRVLRHKLENEPGIF
jgi:hypothetical protein